MLDRLIDLLHATIKNFQFWVVILAYEKGVLLRLGKFHRELGPGLHWVRPFHIDHVLVDNVVTRTLHLGAQSLTTKDGKSIVVSAIVTLSIVDVKKALLEVESVEHAMQDACYAPIARHVDDCTWEMLHKEDAFEGLTKLCRRQAKRYGLEIERVQLADLAICRTYRTVNSDHPTAYQEPKVKVRL
jgi:hypothetical protein